MYCFRVDPAENYVQFILDGSGNKAIDVLEMSKRQDFSEWNLPGGYLYYGKEENYLLGNFMGIAYGSLVGDEIAAEFIRTNFSIDFYVLPSMASGKHLYFFAPKFAGILDDVQTVFVQVKHISRPAGIRRPVFVNDKWEDRNVFQAEGLLGYVYCTEKFRDLFVANHLSGLDFMQV